MNAPVTTTVISVEVPIAGGAARSEVTATFERTIAATAARIGSITKDQGGPQLAVTLPPDLPVGAPIQQLVNAIAEFEAACEPHKVRGVVHYGVVFRSEAGGKTSYLGSAIRSAQSGLKRLLIPGGLAATREFAAYAGGFNPPPVPLQPIPASPDGFSLIPLEAKGGNSPGKTGSVSSSDPDFLAFLKKRLAEDLGPFASAMAENARRNHATAPTLVADLAREIDNVAARKEFESDLTAYLKKRQS
jgi:hypothetical protein